MDKLGYNARVPISLSAPGKSAEVSLTWLSTDGLSLTRRGEGSPAAAPFEAAATSMAMSLGAGLGQQLFFMYMMGNSATIWTIYFLSSMMTAPITALLGIEKSEFHRRRGERE